MHNIVPIFFFMQNGYMFKGDNAVNLHPLPT